MDLSRVCCGGCKSPLTQTKPAIKDRGREMEGNGKEGRRINVFGMFVKEHFGEVRRENPGVSHKEVMAILSRMYRERKGEGMNVGADDGAGDRGVEKENVGKRLVIEIEDDEVVDLTSALDEVIL